MKGKELKKSPQNTSYTRLIRLDLSITLLYAIVFLTNITYFLISNNYERPLVS